MSPFLNNSSRGGGKVGCLGCLGVSLLVLVIIAVFAFRGAKEFAKDTTQLVSDQAGTSDSTNASDPPKDSAPSDQPRVKDDGTTLTIPR
jgi:hypothetical protein